MRTILGLGAEADILTPAELDQRLDQVRADLNRPFPVRIVRRLFVTVTVNASGNGEADLGTPFEGTVWDVGRIGVCGEGAITALAAGTAFILRGNLAPSVGVYSASQFVAWTGPAPNAIPNDIEFGEGQCEIRPEEHLIVYFAGVTASGRFFANADVTVKDAREHDQRMSVQAFRNRRP